VQRCASKQPAPFHTAASLPQPGTRLPPRKAAPEAGCCMCMVSCTMARAATECSEQDDCWAYTASRVLRKAACPVGRHGCLCSLGVQCQAHGGHARCASWAEHSSPVPSAPWQHHGQGPWQGRSQVCTSAGRDWHAAGHRCCPLSPAAEGPARPHGSGAYCCTGWRIVAALSDRLCLAKLEGRVSYEDVVCLKEVPDEEDHVCMHHANTVHGIIRPIKLSL
jgi:hypothetical protein